MRNFSFSSWTICKDDCDRAVPQPLPRAFRRQLEAEDADKVARIVRDAAAGHEPEVLAVPVRSDAAARDAGDARLLARQVHGRRDKNARRQGVDRR